MTEPQDLAYPGGNRDTEETAVTNEMAKRPGFPARKADGTLVLIVDQMSVGTTKVMIDEHGNQYRDDMPSGLLVLVTDETSETVAEEDVNPELDEGVQPEDGVEGHEVFDTFEQTMSRFGASKPGETFDTPEAVTEAVEETVGDETVEATDEDLTESA